MRILAAICVLVVGASAQYTKTGIIMPDGKNVQFTHEQAEQIVLIGPGGAVLKNGQNIQFDERGLPRARRSVVKGVFGESGIVMPDGKNVQFTPEEADQYVAIGPAGAVRKDGMNIQFDERGLPRARRHLRGSSGLITKDGQPVHLPIGVDVAVDGPSGMVLTDGRTVQYRVKRQLDGPSGFITKDGRPYQLAPGATIVLKGPSGYVLSDGTNVQLDP